MIEALWSVKFVVPKNRDYGAGVVVLENGLIRGGDSSYYYLGDFSIKEGVITASVSVNHYFGEMNNVFGPIKHINVDLSGKIAYDQFRLTGAAKGLQEAIYVEFQRLAEISP